jgi:hypothetical protein
VGHDFGSHDNHGVKLHRVKARATGGVGLGKLMDARENAQTFCSRRQLELIVKRTSRLLQEMDEIEVRLAKLEGDLYRFRRPWLALLPTPGDTADAVGTCRNRQLQSQS